MPTTYAHYRFGKDVYRALPGDIRRVIRSHKEAYCIGLHGPDVLFYYNPFEENRVGQTGIEMHKKLAKPFFTGSRYVIRKLYENDKEYSEEALSYILGFICHYALDHGCHGYINARERDTGISHNRIETEFECALLRIDGKDLSSYDMAGHIVASLHNAQIVSEFFPSLTDGESLESLRLMKQYIALKQGRNPLKRLSLEAYLRWNGKYDEMKDLLLNRRPDRRCEESNRRLLELYQKSVSIAVILIKDYLHTERELGGGFAHSFDGDGAY